MEFDSWDELRTECNQCTKCRLHEQRNLVVFGEGSMTPDLVLLGEAPGAQEDKTGKPFVGSAGKILDSLLAEVNLQRSEVFITSVIKCRPPKNRKPFSNELSTCKPFMDAQLQFLKPKLVVLMGNVAIKARIGKQGVSKLHGKIEVGKDGVPYFITFHPAAIIYNRGLTEKLSKDFKIIASILEKKKGNKI